MVSAKRNQSYYTAKNVIGYEKVCLANQWRNTITFGLKKLKGIKTYELLHFSLQRLKV